MLMAFVFVGSYCRSYAVEETAGFTAVNCLHELSLDINGLEWRIVRPCHVNFGSHWHSTPVPIAGKPGKLVKVGFGTEQIEFDRLEGELEQLDRFDSKCRWQKFGFYFGEGHASRPLNDQIIITVVPHWFFIASLTLIYCYLLFVKPTSSKQINSREPKTSDGK